MAFVKEGDVSALLERGREYARKHKSPSRMREKRNEIFSPENSDALFARAKSFSKRYGSSHSPERKVDRVVPKMIRPTEAEREEAALEIEALYPRSDEKLSS